MRNSTCWEILIIFSPGDTFSVPDVVMGMIFLAIGGSTPEASSAFINARNGTFTGDSNN